MAHKISENSLNAYSFNKKTSLVAFGLLALGIALQVTTHFVKFDLSLLLWMVLGYSILTLITIVINNQIRLQEVKNNRENIFEISKILNIKEENIDYDNPGFEMTYIKGKLVNLVVDISNDPVAFSEKRAPSITDSLNNVFGYRLWSASPNMEKKICVFNSKDHPPRMAKFPGTDLRPWNWIPLGVNGEGELAWNLSADGDLGRSLFKYENGKHAKTMQVAKGPQALCVGTTGGGKAIPVDEVVEILR